MTHPNSPVIIRQPATQRWTKPGLHAYNARRRFGAVRERISRLSILQLCLVALGLAGVGYYTYTLADEYVYQSFQNWAFDKGIAGRTNVNFGDYVRESTPFGFLARNEQPAAASSPVKAETAGMPSGGAAPAASVKPVHGAVLGRLEVPRLHLSAMVREGADDKIPRVAIGHIPATALAGQLGNFAIAAHRDTLFRSLKEIRSNDLVTFQSPDGTTYSYRVAATQIVKPSDVSVLRADGGGLITGGGSTRGMPRLLTMITCYPFTYVGSAPKRFIVEAKMVESDEIPKPAAPASIADQAAQAETAQPVTRTVVHAVVHRKKFLPPVRHVAHNRAARAQVPLSPAPGKPAKKKSFWRRIFGNG